MRNATRIAPKPKDTPVPAPAKATAPAITAETHILTVKGNPFKARAAAKRAARKAGLPESAVEAVDGGYAVRQGEQAEAQEPAPESAPEPKQESETKRLRKKVKEHAARKEAATPFDDEPAAAEDAPDPDTPPVEPAPVEAELEAPAKPPNKWLKNLSPEKQARAAQLKKSIREKLNKTSAGVDPMIMLEGIQYPASYAEAGMRQFADFAREMLGRFGTSAKRHLRAWWYLTQDMEGAPEDMEDVTRKQAREIIAGIEKETGHVEDEPALTPIPDGVSGVEEATFKALQSEHRDLEAMDDRTPAQDARMAEIAAWGKRWEASRDEKKAARPNPKTKAKTKKPAAAKTTPEPRRHKMQTRQESRQMIKRIRKNPAFADHAMTKETIQSILEYWKENRPQMFKTMGPKVAREMAIVLDFLADQATETMEKAGMSRSEAELSTRRDLTLMLVPEGEDDPTL
jgi:hypothetical protein